MASVSHPSVAERLSRLAPDQRAAATAPPGPVLCVAPAGSGKTTTLVARVAWLVDGGVDPGSVCIVAFNKRAAEELTARLDAALAPLGVAAGSVRVRTFHALGREILRDAGVAVEPLADRDAVLRDLFPGITRADRGRLDLAFSRLKLDLRVTAAEVAAGPGARADRPRLHRLRGRHPGVGRPRLRRPAGARTREPARGRAPARALAIAHGPPAGGRGAGPGPHPAGAGAAAGRARERRLPGRRRRPDGVLMASRRRAESPRAGRLAAWPAEGGPRDQLPMPATGRDPRRAACRAQPRAVRQADRGRVEGGRAHRPRPRCRRRHRPHPASDGILAGRRDDARGPRPYQPRAAGRGGRRARPRDPVPRARPRPRPRGSAPRRAAGPRRSGGGGRHTSRTGARPGPLPALGRLRA